MRSHASAQPGDHQREDLVQVGVDPWVVPLALVRGMVERAVARVPRDPRPRGPRPRSRGRSRTAPGSSRAIRTLAYRSAPGPARSAASAGPGSPPQRRAVPRSAQASAAPRRPAARLPAHRAGAGPVDSRTTSSVAMRKWSGSAPELSRCRLIAGSQGEGRGSSLAPRSWRTVEGWSRATGEGAVVEPGQGDVLRHPEPEFRGRVQDSPRHDVGEAEERGGTIGRVEQLAGRGIGLLLGVDRDCKRGDLHAVDVERVEPAGDAFARDVVRTGLGRVRHQAPEPGVAEGEQGELGALDRGDAGRRRASRRGRRADAWSRPRSGPGSTKTSGRRRERASRPPRRCPRTSRSGRRRSGGRERGIVPPIPDGSSVKASPVGASSSARAPKKPAATGSRNADPGLQSSTPTAPEELRPRPGPRVRADVAELVGRRQDRPQCSGELVGSGERVRHCHLCSRRRCRRSSAESPRHDATLFRTIRNRVGRELRGLDVCRGCRGRPPVRGWERSRRGAGATTSATRFRAAASTTRARRRRGRRGSGSATTGAPGRALLTSRSNVGRASDRTRGQEAWSSPVRIEFSVPL